MRFRCRLSREGITLLINACQVMNHLSSQALILLESQTIKIAVITESIDSPRGYLEIQAQEFFSEFRIESQHNDQIAFEISIPLWIQALSSSKSSTQAVMKLSKQEQTNQPCLSIILDSQDSLYAMDVTHDIPIKLLKVSDALPFICQPNISPPVVALSLPTKKKLLKVIMDRLHKMGAKTITIKGYQEGKMEISMQTVGLNIHSLLTSLKPQYVGNLQPQTSHHNSATVTVYIKKLVSLLDYQNIPHSDALLCK
jgi:HUS1 checkpoint protein